MPGAAYGIATLRIASQRVEPRASEPSERSRGTRLNSSRQIAEVIGMIMIVRTSAAGSTPDCDGRPRRSAASRTSSAATARGAGHPGPEDEDAPETEDDARDRREQLDHRRDRGGEAPGRELGQEQRDRDRQRRREQQRDERGDDRPVDEDERAVDVRVRVPGLRPDEARGRTPRIAGQARLKIL